MLISDKYKCIFIHNNKVAGTSIEHVLRPGALFRKHYMTAIQIRDFIEEDKWNKYFKFMIVRNPWDKIASLYRYRQKIKATPKSMSFKNFVHSLDSFGEGESEIARNKIRTSNQLAFCTDENGDIIIDYIGRFEGIKKSWDYVCKKIGFNKELPHVKSTRKTSHYSKGYDDEMVNIVAQRFSKDIEYFGYKFVDKRNK